MPGTDSTREFGGKRYRYLCWVKNKSSVDWFKRRAKENGSLMRVTKAKSAHGLPDGYVIWSRGRMPKTQSPAWPKKLR